MAATTTAAAAPGQSANAPHPHQPTPAEMKKADLIAVAVLVDSSLAILAEWPRLYREFVHPLYKRLEDNYPTHQVRVLLLLV